MIKMLFILSLSVSCSMGTISTGGKSAYLYDLKKNYSSADLKDNANNIVETSHRPPKVGKFEDLFGQGQMPIKRVGILFFETEIQPTRGGLSGEDKIYLTASGKQILTENFLNIWEEAIKILGQDFEYVSSGEFIKSHAFRSIGTVQEDFIKSKRTKLDLDDVLFLEKGKSTPMTSVLNAREMQDISFLLVPAYDLMAGPKWSEHNKHFLNDVAKELNLDVVIIVKSQVNWSFIDGESLKVKINASALVPLHSYNKRLENLGDRSMPNVTLCLNSYAGELSVPSDLTPGQKSKMFLSVDKNLFRPMMKTYNDLSLMIIGKIFEDLKTIK